MQRDPFPAAKVHLPPNVDDELRKQLGRVAPVERRAYARGFRAAWSLCAALFTPYLRQWERRWWAQVDEIHALRARIGELVSAVSRLEDRG